MNIAAVIAEIATNFVIFCDDVVNLINAVAIDKTIARAKIIRTILFIRTFAINTVSAIASVRDI